MIVVVADDFSGAAEVAGVAFEMGLSAEVQVDALRPSVCDVVVVDSNTRSRSSIDAASVNRRLAEQIAKVNPKLLYKKVDSLLRGPVAAELDSIRQTLHWERTLLVNANPRKRRFVHHGCLWIDDQPINDTAFAFDPEHPRTSARIPTLLEPFDQRVEVVTNEAFWPGDGLLVGEATDVSHLYAFARRAMGTSTLLAGGSEFFEAILDTCLPHSRRKLQQATLELFPDTLIVSGTSLASQWNSATDAISISSLDSGFDVSHEIRNCFAEQGFAVLTCGDSVAASPCMAPSIMNQRLVETVGQVLAKCQPSQLWVEGGRTASEMVRSFNWDRLVVREVYADGVVGLRSRELADLRLVVKPGSYPWPLNIPPVTAVNGVPS